MKARGFFIRSFFAILFVYLLGIGTVFAADGQVNDDFLLATKPARKLSEYGLFKDARGRNPAVRVVPYDLNGPLFTDYARKFRYVYVPKGAAPAPYQELSALNFPVGSVQYVVPNVNQCKGCHTNAKKEFTPIGPKIRNLNKVFNYLENGELNQLSHLRSLGYLDGDNKDPSEAPRVPNQFDSKDGDLFSRARSYLDGNCDHCHSPGRAALLSTGKVWCSSKNLSAVSIE